MTPYQQNRLSVYKGKIEQIKKISAYLKVRVYFYAAFGIVFSFLIPFYTRGGKSVMERLGGYKNAFMFSIAVVFGLIFIGAVIFYFQDKHRIKKLQKKIALIEAEIKRGQEEEGA